MKALIALGKIMMGLMIFSGLCFVAWDVTSHDSVIKQALEPAKKLTPEQRGMKPRKQNR